MTTFPSAIEVRVTHVGWFWRHRTLLMGVRLDDGPIQFYRPSLPSDVLDEDAADWLVEVERVPVDGYRVGDTTTTERTP